MKIIKSILIVIIFFCPFFNALAANDNLFEAEIIRILNQKEISYEGEKYIQQDLILKGLKGERENLEYQFNGIGDLVVFKSDVYEISDQVLLLESYNNEGVPQYYIVDHLRTSSVYYLLAIFLLTIIVVGRWKGFRSIISLVLTFVVITKYLVPSLLLGANPLLVTIIGSIAILVIIIYFTEGFRLLSHLAVISISVSLLISIFLSWFFVESAKLSGVFGEEIASLVEIGGVSFNFKGLLLAGIIIGLLGVLDDVVIAQISTVEQIHKTNPNQKRFELFKSSYHVGVSHISSMTNTLFLAYAGVSLPLLVLLASGESAFSGFSQFINNEQIATEIVRTLAGSVGLILSVPLSTIIAVWWYKRND
ncbi:YibE/F [Candidatus Parcubacteria bacterium]|nr:MAG: YibE/F [Candidatus Parcubacteria bacterium]